MFVYFDKFATKYHFSLLDKPPCIFKKKYQASDSNLSTKPFSQECSGILSKHFNALLEWKKKESLTWMTLWISSSAGSKKKLTDLLNMLILDLTNRLIFSAAFVWLFTQRSVLLPKCETKFKNFFFKIRLTFPFWWWSSRCRDRETYPINLSFLSDTRRLIVRHSYSRFLFSTTVSRERAREIRDLAPSGPNRNRKWRAIVATTLFCSVWTTILHRNILPRPPRCRRRLEALLNMANSISISVL